MQGAGTARRIRAPALRRHLTASPALRRSLDRYVHVLMTQLAMSAACAHYHRLAPRLARWLLMTQDRARADSSHLTHELMAGMLGVRRAGITAAAASCSGAA